MHLDLRNTSASRVQELRFVDLDVWFPHERNPQASDGWYTPLHEDFYIALDLTRIGLCPHRVCPLEDIVCAGGEEICPSLTYLLGLVDLLRRSGLYVESWVHEFYASLWIDPDHEYLQFTFRGTPHRFYASGPNSIKERLGLTTSTTRLHSLCYDTTDPPKCGHSGVLPGTAQVEVCFRPPFEDGS